MWRQPEGQEDFRKCFFASATGNSGYVFPGELIKWQCQKKKRRHEEMMFGRNAQNTFGLYARILFDEYLRGKKNEILWCFGVFFAFFPFWFSWIWRISVKISSRIKNNLQGHNISRKKKVFAVKAEQIRLTLQETEWQQMNSSHFCLL